jgi:hypothetical protein
VLVPVFSKFRILTLKKETDKRIRQHYEKRWIRRFDPELNFHSSQVPYDVSIKEIRAFILIYEDFFSGRMTWFRYINDEVMKQRPDYKEHSKKLRRRRYDSNGEVKMFDTDVILFVFLVCIVSAYYINRLMK